MNTNDTQLIWESLLEGNNNDTTREGITCFCDDCRFWKAGNTCSAKGITLEHARNESGSVVCECKTYTPIGEYDDNPSYGSD
jgi:hypothetical protein